MPIRLLIIDENPLFREVIPKLIENGHEIEVLGYACNSEDAINKIKEFSPSIILIDIQEKDGTCIDLIKKIKDESPGIRILVFTMENNAKSVALSLELGASGYMLKHTSSYELISAIKAVNEGNSYFHPAIAKTILDDLVNSSTRRKSNSEAVNKRNLTEREKEVLQLIAEGLTNSEVASTLYLSPKTVKTHRKNLMEKLGIHDRLGIYKYAVRNGLIKVDSILIVLLTNLWFVNFVTFCLGLQDQITPEIYCLDSITFTL